MSSDAQNTRTHTHTHCVCNAKPIDSCLQIELKIEQKSVKPQDQCFFLSLSLKVCMLKNTLNYKSHVFFCFVPFCNYSANKCLPLIVSLVWRWTLSNLPSGSCSPELCSGCKYTGLWGVLAHCHRLTIGQRSAATEREREKKKVHRCISVSLRMYRQIPQSPPSNQNCTRRRDKTREVLSSNCSNPGSKWKGALLHIHLVLF